MNRPILVGIDRSKAGEAALEWAALEAGRRGTGLRVLHAFPWPLFAVPIDPRDTDAWKDAERLVKDSEDRARHLVPGIEVTGELADDRPSAALLQRAGEAALLVVGTRGHGGFTGLLIGSTALQVAGHAPCPVVVVGARPHVDAGDVVVGIGSEPADPLLAAAFREAALHGAGLRVIHAMRDARPAEATTATGRAGEPGETGDAAAPAKAPAADGARSEAERHIDALLAAPRARYPEVPVTVEIVEGRARPALVAASEHARLLVVGARDHHRGFTTSGLGSVAHTVVHHAHCPVLITRTT